MLKVISLIKCVEWDRIVKSFSDYDVYYLSGYVVPFAIHGDGEPMLFYYEGDNIRAINVVMRRDIGIDDNFCGKIPPNKYYDFVTPYGYGGWLIEGDGDVSALFDEYQKWCYENGIVSEFLRLHPILANHKRLGDAYNLKNIGNTIAIDLSSRDIVWNNLTSKNRNMIRKAEKNGVTIKTACDDKTYDKFIEIYNATMKRDRADEYYFFERGFYTALQKDLRDNSVIFYAENLEGEMLGASIMLFCNGKLTYHLSGVKAEFRDLAPTNLLLYKAALWGVDKGCHTFHLGGGVGAQEDSLYKFKMSFYKWEPRQYYTGKKIFDMDKYNALLGMRGEVKRTDFFPLYRA